MTDRITRSMKSKNKVNYLDLLSSFEDDFDDESDSDWSASETQENNSTNNIPESFPENLKSLLEEKVKSLNNLDKTVRSFEIMFA